MIPVRIAGANLELKAPNSMPEVRPLHVQCCLFGGEPAMASAWELTQEELAELNNGGKILLVIYGTSHPPVALNVERAPPEELAHDDAPRTH